MKHISSAIFLIAVLFLTGFSAFAQESNIKVVDEVVAQVNDGVITLSRVKREMNQAIDSYVQDGKKTREQAKTEVEGKQGELIANIINEELLLQKGKDIGVDADVEAQINQRFLDIMKQQNIKSLDALYKEMEKTGADPQSIRELWRKQITRDLVLQREVDSKLYFGWTQKDVKSYFDAHKTQFTKPETIGISEIFLSYAGRDTDAVKSKAYDIVSQAKKGADFVKLAVENSDRQGVKENKGKVGTLNIKELDERFAKALQNVKVGGVSDPIVIDEGIEILRVDERTQASSESFFNEEEVRKAMTYEKIPDERKKYMANLYQAAYVKINDTYLPMVKPFLPAADERKAEVKKSSK